MPGGGIYDMEDLATSYYPCHEGGLPAPDSSAVAFLKSLVDNVQARDKTFVGRPEWGAGPKATTKDVASIHIYPGIAFIAKSSKFA
jgi:hypothetical protein